MELKDRLEAFKNKGYTYNPETGIIKSDIGRITTSKAYGYYRVRIRLGDKIINVSNHKLGWYLYYNEVPTIIDHIDRDKTNNRIDNLRIVTHQENCFNKDPKGYYFDKVNRKYSAYITLNNKRHYLGLYKTEQEAHQAYLDAKKIYHII